MLCNGSIHISIYSGIKYSQKVTECKKLYVILRMWHPIKISTINHKPSSTGRKFASSFHSLTDSPCVISYKKSTENICLSCRGKCVKSLDNRWVEPENYERAQKLLKVTLFSM